MNSADIGVHKGIAYWSSCLYNYDDPDLTPVRLKLPTPPKKEFIDGYKLKRENQRFKRLEAPARYNSLVKEANDKALADLRSQESLSLFKIQKKFWELIDEDVEYYRDVIAYIKKCWWHRIYGYWFYNRGIATYIDGSHWTYLNIWKMDDVGYPDYRDRDRKEFLFYRYTYTTHESFMDYDEDGTAIKIDGKYRIKKHKYRTSFGPIQSKNRRSGNTNKSLNNVLEVTSRTKGTDGGGIMSYTKDNSKEHFVGKLMTGWNAYPLFFKPLSTSASNSLILNFEVPGNEFELSGLGTKVTFAETAAAKFYDGTKLISVLCDESGKCLKINTLVRMYDGGVKKVQDVVVGDLLMGDDSTPREVKSLARGREEMFNIIPNKGEPWGCNKSHILSLRCTHKNGVLRKNKDEYFEITVNDFLKLKPHNKKASMLYRVGVDFNEQEHNIPPYLLGVWLGDGHSSGPSITNIDPEIWIYVKEYCKDNNYNLKITDKITKRISANNNKIKSLQTKLKEYNLLKNKHIPEEFVLDSRKNRLQLLAGLLDTDGYAFTGNKRGYEITQKNKNIADGIRRVAIDLGFYCSMIDKIAKMKRDDGSVYKCKVYRLSIYGKNIHEIPCKIERKKYFKKELHKNTRNPLRTGFKVESIGEGDYYGFIIDGNHRFLLEDNTVVHNTTTTNVSDRWKVLKNCLAQGNGKIIHGISYHPSTTEDLNQGGQAYRDLSETSYFYVRNKISGQTISGLNRIFIPGDEALDGYIDSYGMNVKGELLPYQREEGFTETSTEFLMGIRDALLKKGDPESLSAFRYEKKQYPLKYADSWIGESGDLGFDMQKLDENLARMRREKKGYVRGNFKWKYGAFGTEVYWEIDLEEGKWYVKKRPTESMQNLKKIDWGFNTLEQAEAEMHMPMFPTHYTCGADPFEFNNKTQAQLRASKSRMSDGGIAILEHRTEADVNNDMKEWEGHSFVAMYLNRDKNTHTYNEEVLKACIFYGAMLYPENNKTNTWEYFMIHNHGGYLKYDVDPLTGKFKTKPGYYASVPKKDEGFGLLRDYIDYRAHKEVFDFFFEDCKNIRGPEEMTNYDLLAAVIAALLGSKSSYAKVMEELNTGTLDIGSILHGNLIN